MTDIFFSDSISNIVDRPVSDSEIEQSFHAIAVALKESAHEIIVRRHDGTLGIEVKGIGLNAEGQSKSLMQLYYKTRRGVVYGHYEEGVTEETLDNIETEVRKIDGRLSAMSRRSDFSSLRATGVGLGGGA